MSCGCSYNAQGSYECGKAGSPRQSLQSGREAFKLSPSNTVQINNARNEYARQLTHAQQWDGDQVNRMSEIKDFDASAKELVASSDRTMLVLETKLAEANVGANQAVAKFAL
jgi:hypothetical protein